eukprot:1261597-Amphidinium_carterae.2
MEREDGKTRVRQNTPTEDSSIGYRKSTIINSNQNIGILKNSHSQVSGGTLRPKEQKGGCARAAAHLCKE